MRTRDVVLAGAVGLLLGTVANAAPRRVSSAEPWVAGFIRSVVPEEGGPAELRVLCGGAVVDKWTQTIGGTEVQLVAIATATHCLTTASPTAVFFGKGALSEVNQACGLVRASGRDFLKMIDADLSILQVTLEAFDSAHGYCGVAPVPLPSARSTDGNVTVMFWGGTFFGKNELWAHDALRRIDGPACADALNEAKLKVPLQVQGWCLPCRDDFCVDNNSGGPVIAGGALAGIHSGHAGNLALISDRTWRPKPVLDEGARRPAERLVTDLAVACRQIKNANCMGLGKPDRTQRIE